jgi:hypothetical protein
MKKSWNLDGPDGFCHYLHDLRKEPRYIKQRNLKLKKPSKTQNFWVLHMRTVSPENFFRQNSVIFACIRAVDQGNVEFLRIRWLESFREAAESSNPKSRGFGRLQFWGISSSYLMQLAKLFFKLM